MYEKMISYDIYQLKKENTDMLFENFANLKENGKEIKKSKYNLVYNGLYNNKYETSDILNDLYEMLNIYRPKDFTGHSLSVSDIIVIHNEENTVYFVDSFGFTKISDFFLINEKGK